MKVLIVAQSFDNYTIQKLEYGLMSRDHTVLMATPFELAVRVGERPKVIHSGYNLEDIDGALLRCSGFTAYSKNVASVLEFYVGIQLKYAGCVCINDPEAKRKAQDKFYTLQALNHAGIPIPDSFSVWDTDQLDHIIAHYLDVPLIVKLPQGTQGIGVMRADSTEAARSIIEAMRGMGQVITVQKYVGHKVGHDIRAIVINGKVVAAMERSARAGEFRSNIHRGGKSTRIDLPENYAEIAIAAAELLGLGVAGVDLLESKTGPQVIEVNPTPGLEGIETATNIDVAVHIIEYLESLAQMNS